MAGLDNDYEYKETQYKEHCAKIARELDISKYRSVVTVSGDGLFHEFINGIMSRNDYEQASQLAIGTISGGTSNALGKNLDTPDILLATLNIIKSKVRKMDILSIIQNQTILYSHLSVSWALIADIDIESERFRYLGELRMTVMALIRLKNLRNYKGTIYILPVEQANDFKLKRKSEIKYNGTVN
jgi:diacylglycerol kinase family enzyme